MFKKFLCFGLCLVLIFSLTACSLEFKLPLNNNESNSTLQGDISGDDNSKNTETSAPTGSTPSAPSGSATDPNGNTSGTQDIIVDKPAQNVSSENTSISSPTIETPEAPDTHHTAVTPGNYYQYAALSTADKKIYNTICEAIEGTQNIIHLSSYNIDFNKMCTLFDKVMADNPQYFWVSKFMQYTYSNVGGRTKVVDLMLFYTDGTVTDDIGGNNKLTSVADRDKINQQITSFNAKAEEILSEISASAPDVEKEYLIHNAILDIVTYDYSAIGQSLNRVNYSRVYDAYGALVEGKAVCEGYAKLFQYLCYQTGINSTFVRGTSEGQAHAWNTVNIGGEWYFVDTTWDDGSTNDIPIYDYFNLTTEEISATHTIEYAEISVPTATATEYSFTNTFGISINSLSSSPLNYRSAIDYMVKFKSKYLCIMLNGNPVSSAYIQAYFMNSNSDAQKYIRSKGYNLSFKGAFSYTDTCIYLERK